MAGPKSSEAQRVTLYSEELGHDQAFAPDHAARILARKGTSWQLAATPAPAAPPASTTPPANGPARTRKRKNSTGKPR